MADIFADIKAAMKAIEDEPAVFPRVTFHNPSCKALVDNRLESCTCFGAAFPVYSSAPPPGLPWTRVLR